ncbi:hypothetical protein ACJX0J_016303, partial [Zea mays]
EKRLDEMINFLELKMKMPGAKIYLGSTIGAVEEDIMTEGMDVEKNIEDDKGYIDNPSNDEDDLNENEDDLLCSQDLEEFAKDEDLKENMNLVELQTEDASKDIGDKKGATTRAMAKD